MNKRLGDYGVGSTSDLTENFVNTSDRWRKFRGRVCELVRRRSLTVELVEIVKTDIMDKKGLDFDRSRENYSTGKKIEKF